MYVDVPGPLCVCLCLSLAFSASFFRFDLHGRHAQPFLCRLAPQREMMMYPSPSSSPLPDASTRPFVGDAPPRAMSESLSFIKKLGVGLDRPFRPRTLLARVGGFGIPSLHGECSFLRGVTTPRIRIKYRPLLNSFLSLSNKNRMNSCASCCSFPANDGTSFHTLRNKSCGGNASYSPCTIVRTTRRISAPTFNASALAISARRSRVIAGGRITNRLFALAFELELVDAPSSSFPRLREPFPPSRSPFLARFRFNESSNFNSSSSGANERRSRAPRPGFPSHFADKYAAASSPRRYSLNWCTCASACKRGCARE
tara:strand:- start:1137 stop:2078 length:942 start_codon:yes stop_codon:yes gene_type:complete